MPLTRRRFVRFGASLGAVATVAGGRLPAWAKSGTATDVAGLTTLTGNTFDLNIAGGRSQIDGELGRSILINGHLPAPLLRWREGDELTLRVTNHLRTDTSLHWHGLLLPYEMDGVPGVTFAGIKPGETFTYRFPLKQAGTYWYHSHSGLQEQVGLYGPIVIEPREPDPVAFDREYVIVLSDWSFEDPQRIYAQLKKHSDTYNNGQRTARDFLADVKRSGLRQALRDRGMWGAMRMNQRDIADVTGATYTYLVNGHGPLDNWTGLFEPGEKIRLRFINASAMSIFNVRLPGLPMTVVQADGLNVQPVETDEFQIGVAETFDVVVHPVERAAYTLVAESNDRSGMARATLSPQLGMVAAVPALRPRVDLSMKDMAMDHSGMDHAGKDHAGKDHAGKGHAGKGHAGMDHSLTGRSGEDHSGMDHAGMGHSSTESRTDPAVELDHSRADHSGMQHSGMDHSKMNHGARSPAGAAMTEPDSMPPTPQSHDHKKGPGVVGLAMNPVNRLAERPAGLASEPHRVLVYTDLKSLTPNPDTRLPGRELELHLTANMERYMWSFDGEKFSEVDGPIVFQRGERLRLSLVNDTMMPHPIHLHGMFFELVTDAAVEQRPRKHTVVVKPGEKMAIDITADAPGDWAFHCHLLYHMHAGMMRVVSVVEDPAPA